MITLAVFGANGRMGARIVELARSDKRFTVAARYDVDLTPENKPVFQVLIDFSSDAGAHRALELAVNQSAALIVGTTALTPETRRALESAAKKIPVLIAPNMSLGVAVLNHLLAEAARLLGSGYDIDLIESHHTQKKDAPSGTAVRLLDTLAQARGGAALPDDRVHCIRAGDIIGEHAIRFAGAGEVIELSHRATTRDLFVLGALRAAAWIHDKPPGSYSINDVLGLPRSG